MKIIIAGAGEVGVHLAKLLSQENQDIVLMDTNEDNLNIPYNFEIMTVVGNPTSIADLRAAGVKRADMFIAVTPEESTNMTACMIATNLGAQKTIARVSNEEYILPKSTEFFSGLGVASLICPETLAATEIVNALKTPWSRQWWELAGGKLILVGAKVRGNAPIVNKFLYDLSGDEKFYHIVAIRRGNETIIPRGSDLILSGDTLFFTTTPEHVDDIKVLAGKENIHINRVTIMGGSRIGVKVSELLPDHIRIKMVEKNKEKSYHLAEIVENHVMVINGDGRNTDLLIRENIKNCDAFIALTENSETNILACVTAKSLGVPKTVAEVENIDYIQMAEKLDIGTVINKKLIAVSHIYQFMLDADVSTVKCMTFANAEVAELVARPKSKITRKPVKELNLPKDMTLGGKISNGKAEIIDGETTIQAGDHVVVFCLDTAMRKIEDYFN
ncbi:Trk system potassium transport protein TrkA [Bacteroidia bacterium]|nr:Trk system potassium transport protein TrkA [Bacteroidia bacterium]GHU81607.1 Trk system potassium transport protein TrkA [Bacteroidia bacterium]GHV70617.1 Trk system potassium transport protein TrkA [Bacteroidia bacterium]